MVSLDKCYSVDRRASSLTAHHPMHLHTAGLHDTGQGMSRALGRQERDCGTRAREEERCLRSRTCQVGMAGVWKAFCSCPLGSLDFDLRTGPKDPELTDQICHLLWRVFCVTGASYTSARSRTLPRTESRTAAAAPRFLNPLCAQLAVLTTRSWHALRTHARRIPTAHSPHPTRAPRSSACLSLPRSPACFREESHTAKPAALGPRGNEPPPTPGSAHRLGDRVRLSLNIGGTPRKAGAVFLIRVHHDAVDHATLVTRPNSSEVKAHMHAVLESMASSSRSRSSTITAACTRSARIRGLLGKRQSSQVSAMAGPMSPDQTSPKIELSPN
jgi:hypothetical protein